MSAINLVAFEDVLIFLHTPCDCVCHVEETRIIPLVAPIVSRKWTVQMSSDGGRHLVARWFRNEMAP